MSEPKRIQRQRTKGWRMPEGAVYVGRGSKWGNPFRLNDIMPTDDGVRIVRTHAHAVALFHTRVRFDEADLSELRGKDLACWCALAYPDGTIYPCHADVLLEWANGETSGLRGHEREDV